MGSEGWGELKPWSPAVPVSPKGYTVCVWPARVCSRNQAHALAYCHTHKFAHASTLTHASTRARTRTCTRTCSRICTQACMHAHKLARARAHKRTPACTHAHTHARLHTHTPARMRARSYTHRGHATAANRMGAHAAWGLPGGRCGCGCGCRRHHIDAGEDADTVCAHNTLLSARTHTHTPP